jgi:hypothetical protein
MKNWNWDLAGAIGLGFLGACVLNLFIESSYSSFGYQICNSLSIPNLPPNTAGDIEWKCHNEIQNQLKEGRIFTLLPVWAVLSWILYKLVKKSKSN